LVLLRRQPGEEGGEWACLLCIEGRQGDVASALNADFRQRRHDPTRCDVDLQ
jgi:hypothetical protein